MPKLSALPIILNNLATLTAALSIIPMPMLALINLPQVIKLTLTTNPTSLEALILMQLPMSNKTQVHLNNITPNSPLSIRVC